MTGKANPVEGTAPEAVPDEHTVSPGASHMADTVTGSGSITVRRAVVPGADATEVGRLVGDYLRHTEAEKAARLPGMASVADGVLVSPYLLEAEQPEKVFGDAKVYLAELDGRAVGIAVVRQGTTRAEVKRLWVDPSARGKRIGALLLDTVVGDSIGAVALSVWKWRSSAIGLYLSRGFAEVASWDARPELVCMEFVRAQPATTASL